MALLHKADWKYNLTVIPDAAHGAHRDFDMCLKHCHHWKFWVCMLISWNLPHGPWQDDQRWQQLHEHTVKILQESSTHDNALFLEYANDMEAELRMHKISLPEADSIEASLWNYLGEYVLSQRKGYRCNLNRFLGSLSVAKKNLPQWSMQLWERTAMAIEMDMLHGKKFEQLLVRPSPAEAAEESKGTTARTQPGVEDRTLRGCTQNAVAISVYMLSDLANRRKTQCIVTGSLPLLAWHTSQSRKLRSYN